MLICSIHVSFISCSQYSGWAVKSLFHLRTDGHLTWVSAHLRDELEMTQQVQTQQSSSD